LGVTTVALGPFFPRLAKSKQPLGEPMTLGNMRKLGVQRLVATCLNDACRHQGLTETLRFSLSPKKDGSYYKLSIRLIRKMGPNSKGG